MGFDPLDTDDELHENVVNVETILEVQVENVDIKIESDESLSVQVEDNGKIVDKGSDEGNKDVKKKPRTKKQKASMKRKELQTSKFSKKRKTKKEKKNKSNVCSECGKVFDNIYY